MRSQSKQPPLVLIAILNWNSASTTLQCLQLLSKLDYPTKVVVVIDNASTDDSVQILRNTIPDLDLLVAPNNLGYAAGNALALQRAREVHAELFWIVNPDAIVGPKTLSELVVAYQEQPNAIYGSLTLEYTGASGETRVTWPGYPRTKRGNDRAWDVSRPTLTTGRLETIFPTLEPQPVARLSGSSLLIPMHVIEQFGFIDPSFFLYSEETDYSLSLWKKNIPSYVVPTSQVIHNPKGAHKSGTVNKPVILYYQTRNRLIIARRYGTQLAYARVLFQQLANTLIWCLAIPIKGLHAWRNAKFTLLGVVDAVRGRMGKTYRPEEFLSAK